MLAVVGWFLVANGVLDMTLGFRTGHLGDVAIAVAGIVLGVLVLCGVVA